MMDNKNEHLSHHPQGDDDAEAKGSAVLARYTVSMDARLLGLFDDYLSKRGYSNRSEAIRDLIRVALIDDQWTANPEVTMVATVTLIYDHHSNVPERLSELQHEFFEVVVSTTHIHLDAHHCLEVVILRGKARIISQLADALVTIRGVKHGKDVYSSDGENLF